MQVDITNTLLIAVTQIFLASYVMLLIEFRKPEKLWRSVWIISAVLVVAANLTGILFFGFWRIYYSVALITVTLPYILVTLWCSEYKGLKALFSMCTGLFIGCIGHANAVFFQIFIPDNEWVALVVRSVTFVVIYVFLRKFYPYYANVIRYLEKGWGILCMIPMIITVLTFYIENIFGEHSSFPKAILMYGFVIVGICSYILIDLFFIKVQQEFEIKNSRELLEIQVTAQQSRLDAVQKLEESIRIERHNLRHRFQVIASLAEHGTREALMDFIGVSQKQLDEMKPVKWCKNQVMDAVFGFYFDEAKRRKIEVEASLYITEKVPINTAGLSMVVANSLENAIKACRKLPPDKRKIVCRCVEEPRFTFQIENTYSGNVRFDDNGLPMSDREGHGYGVRSVAAFCRKVHALYDYNADEGWFRFRMVLLPGTSGYITEEEK